MRYDAHRRDGISPREPAREAHMRRVIAASRERGERLAAVVGAFHAPALLQTPLLYDEGEVEPQEGLAPRDAFADAQMEAGVSDLLCSISR